MSGAVGAVITAAGLSSRMGDFKPMMQIDGDSLVRRLIHTFLRTGADPVVVVTGHRASLLEEHLASEKVTCLRNERYQSTDMFQSAKIGLRFCRDKCERVLFTPVDVPLFLPETVRALMRTEGRLVCPVCQDRQGHPILMETSLLNSLLADEGEGGLRGALSRLNIPVTPVRVDDLGILRDADTPEEFAQLLEYYNRRLHGVSTAQRIGAAQVEER